MNQTQIIRPLGHIKDFALLGTAFVYAFRWHLGLSSDNFNQTVASYNIDLTQSRTRLLNAKTIRRKGCFLLRY